MAADFDGDGDLDLIIGGHGVRMYRNDGPDPYHGVIFTDMTTKAGLDPYWDQPTYHYCVNSIRPRDFPALSCRRGRTPGTSEAIDRGSSSRT